EGVWWEGWGGEGGWGRAGGRVEGGGGGGPKSASNGLKNGAAAGGTPSVAHAATGAAMKQAMRSNRAIGRCSNTGGQACRLTPRIRRGEGGVWGGGPRQPAGGPGLWVAGGLRPRGLRRRAPAGAAAG